MKNFNQLMSLIPEDRRLEFWLKTHGPIRGGAGIQASNQSPVVTQLYLNTAAYIGDPAPGVTVSTAQASGSIVQAYGGQIGGVLTLGPGGASKRSDPTAQTLFGGNYQYLQVDPGGTNNCVQGQLVFWKDIVNGIVTADVTATTSVIAGVALANTNKGNYWFFQISGIAQIKFRSATTKTTPAIGDMVSLDATPGIFADVIADATNVTSPLLKLAIGRAWATAPTNSTVSPVLIGFPGGSPLPTGNN